ERPALYKSVAERNRQKKHLRDALRDLGVIGDDKPRIDYDMTIEELDALYRSKCAELGHAQQKIFDGLTLHQRAKLYPAALFTDEDRRRADQRGLYMRIASLLAYYLAQRRGDLLDLARSQNIALAAGGAPDTYLFQANDMRGRQWVFAHIVQNKTGAVVEIPLHPKLEAALREHVWRGDYLLSSPAGDHWDEHNFSQCWREECELLGIEDVTLHDLRRTIRSDLAEAACTDEEICAITGHKIASINNNDMADIYTVRNREMAINALEKLIAWEAKVEEFALRREALGITGDEVGDVDFLRQPKLLPAPKKKKRGTA
ncbi:MAG TPA: tyrosine-type recombinase/integrase, partial [Bradyrhizobium sp.]